MEQALCLELVQKSAYGKKQNVLTFKIFSGKSNISNFVSHENFFKECRQTDH